MMHSLLLSTLTFLVVSPAISMCDEDLHKTSSDGSSEQIKNPEYDENVTRHPLFASHFQQDESDYANENSINNPWTFYRQLRAPSGFLGVRGKKDFEPANYWNLQVISANCILE